MTTMPATPDLPRTRAKLGSKRSIKSLVALASLLGACAATVLAQTPTTVISPPSSIPGAASAGVRAHTHLQMLGTKFTGTPNRNGPPVPGLFYETPASIACIYGLRPPVAGCNPNTADAVPTPPNGGIGAIAVVDAYDNPNAVSDFQVFNAQFGLNSIFPAEFLVLSAAPGGATPGSCSPGAHPPTLADLLCAVSYASTIVQSYGGGEVSMSWGLPEIAGETAVDLVFTTPGVVYFASTGDGPGTQYPSVSPNVVAVGGTSLSRNPPATSASKTRGNPPGAESAGSNRDRPIRMVSMHSWEPIAASRT